jgi:hypothetical protein
VVKRIYGITAKERHRCRCLASGCAFLRAV